MNKDELNIPVIQFICGNVVVRIRGSKAIPTAHFFLMRVFVLDKAMAYKDEGNEHFKSKQYKKAVISYTEGLKQKIEDNRELSSVLHNNRASAHFHMGNYRSAFNDVVFARKFNKANVKAIYRGAECCLKLKQFDDAIKWCETVLSLSPQEQKAKDLRGQIEIAKVIDFSKFFFLVLSDQEFLYLYAIW